MAEQTPPQTPAQKAKQAEAQRKQERLRVALKANMGRRKTQARARSASDTGSAGAAPQKET